MSAEEIALAQKVSERKRKQPRYEPFISLGNDVFRFTPKTEFIVQTGRGPRHWQFRSIHDGLALARNSTGKAEDWEWLNRSGKWQPGADAMAPYIWKGEIGDEEVGEDEARVIAEKLNGTFDGPLASEEEIRAIHAEKRMPAPTLCIARRKK